MRQFLCQHYALSSRRDTPYWKHVTEEIEYDNVTAKFDKPILPNPVRNTFVDLAHRINVSREFDTRMGGIAYIATGMGYNPINSTDVLLRDARLSIEDRFDLDGFRLKSLDNWKETKAKYEKHRAKTQSAIDKMPCHYQFLKDNIYNDCAD